MEWRTPVLEILSHEEWIKVSNDIFAAWSGDRRLDGSPYYGPVYRFGTDEVAKPFDEAEWKRKSGR